MKITLSSTELLKKLNFLGGVINNSNSMPILDNFLFEIENGQLKITASDLETTMSTTIDVDFEGKASVAIPAKLLIEVLKTFSEQTLIFTTQENNTIEISSNSGQYEIAYFSAEEFPKLVVLEEPSSTVIPSKVLANAISKTLFATGTDDLRPVMTGVYFQLSPEGLIFTATDAHKLVKYSRTDVKASENANFIMPKKPLGVLKAILSTLDEAVKIEFNNSNAVFSFENYIVSCRLIDGKYPDYERVIPKDNPSKLIIDRSLLLQSVKRVATFSNKTTHQIVLKVAGTELNISTQDVDYSNKADERLTCNFEGEDIQIGFNSRFLSEMLGILQSTTVQLELSTPVRAGILKPIDGLEDGEEILMLAMPVKI
jgi:DNA polymerase-3 subunit beta